MKKIILFTLSLLSIAFHAKATTISIRTQQEFDALCQTLLTELNKGASDIVIYITQGTYTFNQVHMNMNGWNYPHANVTIKGNNAVLVGGATNKNVLKPYEYTYLDQSYKEISCWSETIQLNENIEVMDVDKKLCRIRLPKSVTSNPKFVNISQWYLNGIYPVVEYQAPYVYFTANDLSSGYSFAKYSVNNDYGYARLHPRCQLFYGSPKHYQYKCAASQFIGMGTSSFKCFTLEGLTFLGNGGNSVLLMFHTDKVQSLIIRNCSFQNINGVICYLVKTPNATFCNNTISDCNEATLISENESLNTQALNNDIAYIGKRMNNVKVIQCVSRDFLIKGNTIRNFSYAAVGSGLGKNGKSSCSGVIESNEIFYTQDFYNDAWKYTLMDGGAIYVGTKTDGVTIRNNYIHDISGMKDNRGIFCDDGTKNVSIEGNIIQRIQNSYCIDLRNVENVAVDVPDHNTGNKCFDNLVDGKIRFYIRDNSCKSSNNRSIGTKGYKTMRVYRVWKKKIK